MTANMPAIRRGIAVDTALFGVGAGLVVWGLQYGQWQPLTIGATLLWMASYDMRAIRRALRTPVPVTGPDGGGSGVGHAATRRRAASLHAAARRPSTSLRSWPPDIAAGVGSRKQRTLSHSSVACGTATNLPSKAQR